MKNLSLILALIFSSILIGCERKNNTQNNLIVIVKYKTLPSKSVIAFTSIKKLIEKVEKEDHFVTLKLHIDQKDNSNILLYEEWDDELYYNNQHMKTDHLQKFIRESQAFLVGSPEISFWKVHAE